jgi:AmmeMemoRadiSam system protein B
MQKKTFADLRPSPIAGSWYAGDAVKLETEISSYLGRASLPNLPGEVVSLIVPHAGHIYSGLTAAHAFKAIEGKNFQRVVILAPSHHSYHAPLLTTGHEAYSTPLGAIPVDRDALEALDLEITPVRNDREHSLEIELPFLQVLLPEGFNLVPIVVLDQSPEVMNTLGEVLAKWVSDLPADEKTLMIASSDLSHFHQESLANELDGQIIDALASMDAAKLYQVATRGTGEACGLGPMAAVLTASKLLGANSLTIADYRTSAVVSHDTSSVVGYVSAVLTKPW